MEYVEGADLGKLVKKGGPLPVSQACEYIRQAARALQYAHERGLVHRDVKPHNLIMSVKEGLVKLTDLGLARLPRAVNEEATAVLTGVKGTGTLTPENAVLIGTADYMSPEQALDFHGADIRADIYSLGCTLCYLLTGQPPFAGGMLAQKLLRHQQAAPPPVERMRADVPSSLGPVIRRMLAKRPEDRYQVPADVVRALQPFARLNNSADVHVATVLITAPAAGSLREAKVVEAQPACLNSLGVGGWGRAWEPWPVALVPGWPADRSPPARGERRKDPTARTLCLAASRIGGSPGNSRPAPLGAGAFGGRQSQRQNDCQWRCGPNHSHLGLRHGPGTDCPLGAQGTNPSVGVRPDGLTLASSAQEPGPQQRAWLWDIATGKVRIALSGHKGSILALAFASKSQMLATASEDKSVKLWASTGKELANLREHTGAVRGVAFSPDGSILVTASDDTTVKLWQVPSAKAYLTLTQHTNDVHCVAFAPQGNMLASASRDQIGRIKLWDVARRVEHSTLQGHVNWVASLSFAPDGRTLASGSVDGTVRLWDTASGIEKTDAVRTPVAAVAFAPDGKSLVSGGSDGYVAVWDAATGKPRTASYKGHRGAVRSVAYSPDGRTLVSSSPDGTVRLWDLPTTSERAAFNCGPQGGSSVAFSPDGETVAFTAGGIVLRDVVTGAERALAGHLAMVTSVAFDPKDGNTLVSAGHDKTVGVWDVASRKLRSLVKEHLAIILSLAHSPAEPLVASGSADGLIVLWDTVANKRRASFRGVIKGSVNALAFAPDGKTFASGGSDKLVKLWDVATGKLLKIFEEHQGALRCVAFSPSGRAQAEAGDSGQIILRDRASQKVLWDTRLPGPVYAIAFSPDGRHLATGNANGTVYILRLPQ